MLTQSQRDALLRLASGPVAMASFHPGTANALTRRGWAERFMPEARTLAAASRGRVAHLRITDAGVKVLNGG